MRKVNMREERRMTLIKNFRVPIGFLGSAPNKPLSLGSNRLSGQGVPFGQGRIRNRATLVSALL
jgi:hypothetical protein